MRNSPLLCLALVLMTSYSLAHRVLTINDVHLDINSTQLYSEPGTESSITTLQKVLQEAAEEEAKSTIPIDAILLIGDLCKHGMAVSIDAESTNWEQMKVTMREALAAIQSAFPDIPILPVIGNNDVPYHDQAPSAGIKDEYYSQLWDIMFKEVPANAALYANSTIEATWKLGGYYVYELDDDTMVLSLNGMYPFYENFEDAEMATTMLKWVSDTLEANSDKHFLTQTHVFFGNNWYNNLEVLWNRTYTDEILTTLQQHQDRLILCLGAHIHHVQIMAPLSSSVPDLNIVQVISPAISPIYMNNPGYGQLTFSAENGVENLLFRFFQLEDFQRLGVVDFVEYDLMKYTGVDLNEAESVRTYINSLFYNFQAYAGYIARNMGLRDFLAQGSQFFWPFFSKIYSDQTDQIATVCSLQYFDISLFPSYCMKACKAVALPSNQVGK